MTLVDLLRARARDSPHTVSHRYLKDGVDVTHELTYAELDRGARAAAATLRRFAEPGDRVLLLYPAGLEFLTGFFASLYAGLIAVPASAPKPQQRDDRIRAIARDARPSIAVSTPDLVERCGGRIEWDEGGCPMIALDGKAPADEWRAPDIRPESIAHLQYTSGSTATPKGVMVTHANILHNLADLHGGWGHDASSVIVTWLPHFHDMGLVYGLLGPIYGAIPGIVMPPIVFMQRPVRWLQAIGRFGGTHSAAPNFAYDHCVRRVKPEDRAALDVSSWRVAVNGAEPVRAATIDAFTAAFEPAGFRRSVFAPGYGLAEATLKVCAARNGEGPTVTTVETPTGARTLIGNGRPMAPTRVAIVDPATRRPCAAGDTGEIWVGGPSVAAGYWSRPEESAATFAAEAEGLAGPFLRTGDLGVERDGQLYVAGRLKDVIIIRGQNYYPQDLELTAERSGAAVRPGAAAAFGIDRDEEALVIVIEAERGGGDRQAQVDLIRQAIARDHDLHVADVVLVRAGGVPKTSSGKIQRAACRAAYLEQRLDLARDTPA